METNESPNLYSSPQKRPSAQLEDIGSHDSDSTCEDKSSGEG